MKLYVYYLEGNKFMMKPVNVKECAKTYVVQDDWKVVPPGTGTRINKDDVNQMKDGYYNLAILTESDDELAKSLFSEKFRKIIKDLTTRINYQSKLLGIVNGDIKYA